MAVPTYPIVLPADGARIDPLWGIDITNGLNDHQTRLQVVETQFVPQISYSTNGTLANSPNTSTEGTMSGWTGGASASFLFRNGWVHELTAQGGCADNGTAFQAGRVIIRIRKNLASTAGSQLGFYYAVTRGVSSVINWSFTRYVKNTSGADITAACGLTIQSNAGGASTDLYGDSSTPLMLTMKPLGTTTSLTGFAAIAAAIT